MATPTLKKRIMHLVQASPGLTDREITDLLLGGQAAQQAVNQACRSLASKGLLRRSLERGLLRNYLSTSKEIQPNIEQKRVQASGQSLPMSEDRVKKIVQDWLVAQGWEVEVAWGKERGIDILAKRGNEKWIIEVKGQGGYPQMQGNYFLNALGETLQRMNDSSAKYSIAFPDIPRYRGLWDRLPPLAKQRTVVSFLAVSSDGTVSILEVGDTHSY